jgi:hypothetical protein
MTKRDVLAFLLGAFTVLAVNRWIALETASYKHEMHINYIEGFLERATGGGR